MGEGERDDWGITDGWDQQFGAEAKEQEQLGPQDDPPSRRYRLRPSGQKSLTPDDHSMIGGVFHAAREAARAEGLEDSGYRLVINQGSDSGQEVPHLHLHVLGGRRLGEMG